jgi:single-strand DNA-binding protein
MSEGINKVFLAGRLGADPELRHTTGGQAVLKLRMVTNSRIKKRDGEWADQAEWHSVVVWGKRAEGLGKILSKGASVVVEGKLQTRSYESQGQKRYSTEVVADNVVLGSAGGGGSQRQSSTANDDSYGDGNWGTSPPDDDSVPF